MYRNFLAVVLASLAISVGVPFAHAQEPVGCDKFKWPIEAERALLTSAAPVSMGAEISQPLASGIKLALSPFAQTELPVEPSRKPKSADSYAGFVRFAALPQAGTYRVTLSEGAWVDVVQAGHAIKSGAFSGATGCEGIRKSVKFDLAAAPFVVEISGTSAQQIAIVVTKD
jgi:hypothetical protein